MKNLPVALILSVALTFPAWAEDATPQDRNDHLPAAPYLLAGAPTFDMTIAQFREKYNAANPDLPLLEYRAIDNRDDKSNLTRAASKINETLYASTALEQGSRSGYEDRAGTRDGLYDGTAALLRSRIVPRKRAQETRYTARCW